MLDIIFISYDEPNADENYRILKDRFPHAKRVHGVKGIANAHFAAAKKAFTQFFYVVDADAKISSTFNFSHKPAPHDAGYVHIWLAYNQALGVAYGYGGVKLFNKKFFKDIKSQLDFSTTLTKDVKYIDEVACMTEFNSDAFRAFRGAFRESAKLYRTANDSSKPEIIRREANERLWAWQNPAVDAAFRSYIVDGSNEGIELSRNGEDISLNNDHKTIVALLKKNYPYEDLSKNPIPADDNPMKPELFFTTRIASAMFDDYVFENLKTEELRDALSDGQLLSKNWLYEKLVDVCMGNNDLPPLHRMAILGGWIGTLPLLLFSRGCEFEITSFDLDHRANRIADTINYGFPFRTVHLDMYDVDYSDFDIIINTSSEHIPDITRWASLIPKNKLLIVQNNNFKEGEGHVSCVRNSDELRKQLRLDRVIYEGTRSFTAYDRYMVIGLT